MEAKRGLFWALRNRGYSRSFLRECLRDDQDLDPGRDTHQMIPLVLKDPEGKFPGSPVAYPDAQGFLSGPGMQNAAESWAATGPG